MTAAEAREAAAWFSNAATYDHNEGSKPGREWYAMRGKLYDRAAVALDAFADGIDAAVVEREACAGLADRTEARWREQERSADDDFTRSRCFARADVAGTLARAIRARGQS